MTERQIGGERLCIVCGQEKMNGICIVSEFICDACETEMVRTDVQDAKYPFFIHQLKRLWVEKNA
ncbi:sigma factor G inhibitor Gin [Paenibacillus methanolicus]|uniref:Inhibitor of sigma-G Gin protein n=1 Tax=Paenibacillus methanolicus TaxID=582686 RepID=A0A5S5BLM7_9BACL|nr:sigma factor G inhibitor Gin [Paenibacillus methanolicus]TYP67969.1 inhibitor of sigma-G Gin protein [Paenibacillus methanolicus]